MSQNPTSPRQVAPGTGQNAQGALMDTLDDPAEERFRLDAAAEREPDDDESPSASPTKPRRRWRLALLGLAAMVGIAGGMVYYLHSLSYESTDDAFIEGHIVPVSPRVAGHLAKVYVTDNQWVNQGDLLAEIDPRDFEAKLAGKQAALAAAQAGHASSALGVDVTEITSTADVQQASAAVEGARAAVETSKAAVATAKSQQAQAQAQLTAAEAGRKQAQADLEAAQARQERAQSFLQRIEALVPERAASQDSLDEAVAAERVAEADVAAARERIAAQEAAIAQAQAAVAAAASGVQQAEAGVAGQQAALERAEAQQVATTSAPKQVAQSRSQTDVAQAEAARAAAEVQEAQLNLSYTKILAPTAGHVTRKSIEPGAYVQVGQPLLALVDPNVWVIANFKETQLAHMQPGQSATVTVDTHPGVVFPAHVDSIQSGSGARFSLLPPENATGNYVKVVQRIPVKIVFDDPQQVERYALGPGMSVVPKVKLNAADRPEVGSQQAAAAR